MPNPIEIATFATQPTAMKQYEAVIATIEQLGGLATIGQICQEVFKIKECEWKTKTPRASIRRIVRHTPGIMVVRRGLYALESMKKQLTEDGIFVEPETSQPAPNKEFNHTYYQGLLVSIAQLKGLDSYVPPQDKNKHFLNGSTLGEMASLDHLPLYTYQELVHRSSSIDTIWMNQRHMPHSFFEVEHTTDIQNSLGKFADLQDFSARMVIVADNHRRAEYEHKLAYRMFDELREVGRVNFLSYDDLEKQYVHEVEQQDYSFVL